MEPDIVAFLKRVALVILVAFCWLGINVIIGVRFDLAEVEGHVTIGNVLYYIWLVGSLIGMLFFFLRLLHDVPRV